MHEIKIIFKKKSSLGPRTLDSSHAVLDKLNICKGKQFTISRIGLVFHMT